MYRHYLLSALLLVSAFTATAQTLYMPRDVKKAYASGTRSMDGQPGSRYWQNHARYHISMSVMPPGRTVRGAEDIVYVNNSPDTLRNLLFKVILNIHKPGAVRNSSASQDYLNEGVIIDSLIINGKASRGMNNPMYFTNIPVRLQEPLNAHDSVHIRVKWHYEISLKSNREGMIDSTTYFLAYFYPRVAVYDDYAGWDFMAFNEDLEFYNDFNDYIVSIQAPANYIVWGTGTFHNPDEVLQPSYAEKYKRSLTSDELVHVADREDIAAKRVTRQGMNTWHFSASNIPDVAFAVSDHFVWDASSVIADPSTGRRASVQAAYNDTAADFHHMVSFGKHAINWFSDPANWPGIPYPYEKSTIVQGYAGMEYPMMVNDETYDDTAFSKFVAAHEIAHTYMPFYMGINETRYGFMDEGWATTFEFLINEQDMGRSKAEDFYKQFRVMGWVYDNAADEDLPIITPGPNLNGGGLGNNEYGKPSLGYLAVKDMLGDALFKKALHAYMDRWHGKHPIPWDFFHTMNDASGTDLNWFWNNWFFSYYYIDLAIREVKGSEVIIDNIGGMAAPFDLQVTYSDGSTETIHYTSLIWKENQKEARIKLKKKPRSLHIQGGIFMDANEANNSWVKE